MITFSNHLEIRCAYARALVLEKIHGERAEIVQEAFLDVHDAAVGIGFQDFDDCIGSPPILFSSEPVLLNGWEHGYNCAAEYAWGAANGSDDDY